MRKFLDRLYRLSGVMGVLFLAMICVIVVLQVGANTIDRVMGLTTGRAIGLLIPSYAEFAGFFLAGTSFTALAHTYRKGALIRVTLMIQRIRGPARRWIELWCTGVAGFLTAFAAVHVTVMVFEAHKYNELSTGLVAVPMWIPQLSVIFGITVLAIALIDDFICLLMGHEPSYARAEETGPHPGTEP